MSNFTTNNRLTATALHYVFDHSVPAMQLVIFATSLGWLAKGNVFWFTVGIVSVIPTFLPALCIADAALRAATSLCISALVFAHVFFGMQAGFYETSIVYDKLMHALGSGAIAMVVIAFLSRYCHQFRIKLSALLVILLVTALVVSLGTLWEIFEFAVDRTGLFQSQKGLADIMLDLIADALGAGVATWAVIAAGAFTQYHNVRNARPHNLPWYAPTQSIGEYDA
ncbi:MAG: hypothetical protein GY789_06600 [Hyphomicrobiales bacterium]|nr:hypothetical protein [Hyphomicrobiales bacterium]MCP5000812.1 hypothetical protein [Hyphomicrobiales bacterium]